MEGRHSTVVGIRFGDDIFVILEEIADKKGITVSAFIKGKVEEFVRLAKQSLDKEEFVVVGGTKFRKGG